MPDSQAGIESRVAILEEQNRAQAREHAKLEARLDTRLGGIEKSIADVRDAQTKQKGFWAGVTFFASIVAFMAAQAWAFLTRQA